MQNVHFHLAFLLTKHECIVIPGFGALVVSPHLPAESPEGGIFSPPGRSLGFNPELKHNDGLLANSLMKEKKIGYNESCRLIEQYVEQIRRSMATGEIVEIPWVGDFRISPDKKIIFRPAPILSCNATYYGFEPINLPTLPALHESNRPNREQKVEREEKGKVKTIAMPGKRRHLVATGAVAAAMALFIVSTPLNDHRNRSFQSAGIWNITASTLQSPESRSVPLPETGNKPKDLPGTIETGEAEMEKSRTYGPYYIVISSLPSRKSAEESAMRLREGEFPEAAVISSEERHRIYVRNFEDKTEAERYLNRFREENPRYAKAWLLAQKKRGN